MATTEFENRDKCSQVGAMQANRIDELTYRPSTEELPLFTSLFRRADKNKNYTFVLKDEALEVLALSCLSRKKLSMILKMSMKKESNKLNKNQFYVAVRLVQFRQNHETVRNLTLTVPDDIDLKPPFFRGFLESSSHGTSSTLDTSYESKIDETQLLISAQSSLKCLDMEKEISKLKEELQTTIQKLHVVTKDNYILRQEGSRVYEPSKLHTAIVQRNDTEIADRKTSLTKSESKSNLDRGLSVPRAKIAATCMQNEVEAKEEERIPNEIPRGRRRVLSKRRENTDKRYSVISIPPQLDCDDSLISDITEFTEYKYHLLDRSRSIQCLGIEGFKSNSEHLFFKPKNRIIPRRSKSFSGAYRNSSEIINEVPSKSKGFRSFFKTTKAKSIKTNSH